MRSRLAIPVLFALVVASGWAFANDPAPAPKPPPKPSEYRTIALTAASSGSIEGRCVLEGDVPVVTDAAAKCFGGPRPSDRVVVGKDGGLSGCVVSLVSIAEGKDWPESMQTEDRKVRLVLAGSQARFAPRVSWARIETQLVIENRTACDMNAHGFWPGPAGAQTVFNFAVEAKTTKDSIADAWLARPGPYAVRDDCCHGIDACVMLSPHPYVVVTDATDAPGRASGSLRLTDVPSGSYELVCFHEPITHEAPGTVAFDRVPPVRDVRPVVVEAGKTSVVDFTIPVSPAARPK